jgi:hypothetical protein
MDPPERRVSARHLPTYQAAELKDLQITRVHFREQYLFCLLGDGNMVCVPLTISPVLEAAPQQARYQWKISDDGKAVLWYTKGMGVATERLAATDILSHPDARITALPR